MSEYIFLDREPVLGRDVGTSLKGSPAAPCNCHLQLVHQFFFFSTVLLHANPGDYVSIMLAVRCLFFAAVSARFAVTGKRLGGGGGG